MVSALELNSAIAAVSRVIPKNPSRPIWGMMHVQNKREGVYLTGGDSDIFVRRFLGIEPFGTDMCVRKPAVLADLAKLLDGDVELSAEDEPPSKTGCDRTLNLRISTGEYRFAALPPDEYPAMPDKLEEVGEISAELKDAILGAQKFMASPKNRHWGDPLLGVIISGLGEEIGVAATDEHFMFRQHMPWAGQRIEASIPRCAMSHLKAMRKPVLMRGTDQHHNEWMGFKEGADIVVFRSFPGLPSVWQVTSANTPQWTCDRRSLIKALEGCAVAGEFARITPDFDSQTLILKTEHDGKVAERTIPATISLAADWAKMNIKKLVAILKAAEGTTVKVRSHWNKPWQIMGDGGTEFLLNPATDREAAQQAKEEPDAAKDQDDQQAAPVAEVLETVAEPVMEPVELSTRDRVLLALTAGTTPEELAKQGIDARVLAQEVTALKADGWKITRREGRFYATRQQQPQPVAA